MASLHENGSIILSSPTNLSRRDRRSFAESSNGARLGPLSSPGIVSYSGILHYPKEKDRAWSDQFSRDETIIEMSNNPIIGGVLRQISMFIRQVTWELVPADSSPAARKVADFYQEQLDGMKNLWPGETMPQLLTFLTWGWAALEIIYKPLPDGRIGWEEWRLIPQETRWGWVFNDFGEATHLVQLDPQTYKDVRVPLTKCLHIRDTARNNSPEGFTLLRIAYDAYFYRSGFQQLEGTLFERYGGVQVARLPGDDISAETEAYQEIKRIVTTLGINAQTGLVLASDRDPITNEFYQDFKIESPASGATVPSADPIINRYANEIVGVFGAAVTRTGQEGGGSFALAEIQSEIFQRNMEAYLDLIGDNIMNQAFPRLAEIPYNNIPVDLIPTLKHGTLDKIKLSELGAFLVSLAQSGVIHDSPELREYVHTEAAIPIPPLDELKKEMDDQKARQEEASQQKIAPLDAQNAPPKTQTAPLDSQAVNQDAVPQQRKQPIPTRR
jgi:hypothetical protein